MRRTAALLLFLAVPAVAQDTSKPFSLFLRSQHYSMNIDVVPLADDAYEYNVTVIDLATNAVVAQQHFGTAAEQSRAIAQAGDQDILVSVRRLTPAEISASLDVVKGNMVIDSIHSVWTTKPHERRFGGFGGPVNPPRPLPPDTYRVGGDVKAPVVISRVEPGYTAEARKARISGIVIVEAMIDKSGVVRDVQVLKPLPFGLDQSAVDAVRQWRFEPGTRNGQPVNVIFDLTVSYHLDTGKPKQ